MLDIHPLTIHSSKCCIEKGKKGIKNKIEVLGKNTGTTLISVNLRFIAVFNFDCFKFPNEDEEQVENNEELDWRRRLLGG